MILTLNLFLYYIPLLQRDRHYLFPTRTIAITVKCQSCHQEDRDVIYLFSFPWHLRDSSGKLPKDPKAGIFVGNSRNFLSMRFSHFALSPFVSSYLPFCQRVIQKNGDESPSSGPLTLTKRELKRKRKNQGNMFRETFPETRRF